MGFFSSNGARSKETPADSYADSLMKTFYQRGFAMTAALALSLFFLIPTLIWCLEIRDYKEESVRVIEDFLSKEFSRDPWGVFEHEEALKALNTRVYSFMKLSNFVEFKVWRADGTVMYSYYEPGLAGTRFDDNHSLKKTVQSGEPLIEVEAPESESESLHLSKYKKLFEIYVPLQVDGKTAGAVELYRIPPEYRFWGEHVFLIALLSALFVLLLYLFMYGSFKRASGKIIEDGKSLKQAYRMLGSSYFDTVSGLIKALELKDADTEGHSVRVVALSMRIAEALRLDEDSKQELLLGSYLHDIGKIGISDSILLKPGPLTDEERKEINTHVTKGYEIIKNIHALNPACDVVLSHHEKWNGSGYPVGLRKEAIPLAARIFSLVDVYDALRRNRPYKSALGYEETIGIINTDSGSHFDPEIVRTFNTLGPDEIDRVVSDKGLSSVVEKIGESFQEI